MSEDKDKKANKNKGKAISAEEASLWQSMTHDVKPLPGKRYDPGCTQMKAPGDSNDFNDSDQASSHETIMPECAMPALSKAPQSNELDRRTEERLRKGKMAIEARLDLHGMIQEEAHEALNRFIERAAARGQRCVLVITGKGKSKAPSRSADWFAPTPGVLKRRVPDWLAQAPLQPLVLKAVPAKQKDGGEGALYVYLRRKRDG